MMDQTCDECKRLWQEYEKAAEAQRIIETRFAVETGLETLVRKVWNRCQQARQALQDHEAAHEGQGDGKGNRLGCVIFAPLPDGGGSSHPPPEPFRYHLHADCKVCVKPR